MESYQQAGNAAVLKELDASVSKEKNTQLQAIKQETEKFGNVKKQVEKMKEERQLLVRGIQTVQKSLSVNLQSIQTISEQMLQLESQIKQISKTNKATLPRKEMDQLKQKITEMTKKTVNESLSVDELKKCLQETRTFVQTSGQLITKWKNDLSGLQNLLNKKEAKKEKRIENFKKMVEKIRKDYEDLESFATSEEQAQFTDQLRWAAALRQGDLFSQDYKDVITPWHQWLVKAQSGYQTLKDYLNIDSDLQFFRERNAQERQMIETLSQAYQLLCGKVTDAQNFNRIDTTSSIAWLNYVQQYWGQIVSDKDSMMYMTNSLNAEINWLEEQIQKEQDEKAKQVHAIKHSKKKINLEEGNLEIPQNAVIEEFPNARRSDPEIVKNQPLFTHTPNESDVQQPNNSEICYFCSVLISMAKVNPSLISKMIKDTKDGFVIVKLHDLDYDSSTNKVKIVGERYFKIPKEDHNQKGFDTKTPWYEYVYKAYRLSHLNKKNYEIEYQKFLYKHPDPKEQEEKFPGWKMKIEEIQKNPNKAIDKGFEYLTTMNLLGVPYQEIPNPDIGESNFNDRLTNFSAYTTGEQELYQKFQTILSKKLPLGLSFKEIKNAPIDMPTMPTGHAYAVMDTYEKAGRKFVVLIDPYRGERDSRTKLPGIFYKLKADGKFRRKYVEGEEKIAIELSDLFQMMNTMSVPQEEAPDQLTDSIELPERLLSVGPEGFVPETLKYVDPHIQHYLDEKFTPIVQTHPNPVEFLEKINTINQFLKESVAGNQTAFAMQAPPNAIQSIFEEGEIKNRFGIKSPAGVGVAHKLKNRQEASKRMFGVPVLEDENGRLYEKYGYISEANVQSDLAKTEAQQNAANLQKMNGQGIAGLNQQVNSKGISKYGGVIFLLKKEQMLSRTTITLGDSLNFVSANNSVVPATKANNPEIRLLHPTYNDNKEKFYQDVDFIYEQIESKQLKVGDIKEICSLFLERSELKGRIAHLLNLSNANYFELQFHGKLTTDLIEKVVINAKVVKPEWRTNLTNYLSSIHVPYEIING